MTTMINRAAYEALEAAEMPQAQARVVATYLPDWSQFATKTDLETLRLELTGEMRQLESRLIRWMVGTLVVIMASILTLGSMLLLALNSIF